MSFDQSISKPVLVTGAAGLVGRQVVRRLVEQGRPVLALDRLASVTQEGVKTLAISIACMPSLWMESIPSFIAVRFPGQWWRVMRRIRWCK